MNINQLQMAKEQIEKKHRWHKRHTKMSQFKGYQDALIALVEEMNDYKISSCRKTIDVDTVMEMLWNHIYENKDDASDFVDEMNGKGKVLHLDETVKWRAGS